MTAYDQLQTRLQAEPKIWLDTGTHDSLLDAGQSATPFISVIPGLTRDPFRTISS